MKERALIQTQVSTQPCHDVEKVEPVELRPTTEHNGAETKLRPIRTICLSECVIPE